MEIVDSNTTLVENLFFHNSPYWTFWANRVDGLEVRNSHIHNRRTTYDGHDIIDMTAFNTDGFDVAGKNIWIHDCDVWNQDDSFCVKDASENVLIERVNASGMGLVIGSINDTVVRNITFRDAHLHNTFNGIYMKFRGDGGSITNVTYENIVIDNPERWAIWIGPAQQAEPSRNICHAGPCSICWPTLPWAECNAPRSVYEDITLRNITINNSKKSPGVMLFNKDIPMKNLTFDGVKFNRPGNRPWGFDYFKCENVVNGVAKGDTWPVPKCFTDQTNKQFVD